MPFRKRTPHIRLGLRSFGKASLGGHWRDPQVPPGFQIHGLIEQESPIARPVAQSAHPAADRLRPFRDTLPFPGIRDTFTVDAAASLCVEKHGSAIAGPNRGLKKPGDDGGREQAEDVPIHIHQPQIGSDAWASLRYEAFSIWR